MTRTSVSVSRPSARSSAWRGRSPPISGIVGAYGNIGALVFLTLLLVTGPRTFFLAIGAGAVVAALACRWLVGPEHAFAPAHADEDPGAGPAAAAARRSAHPYTAPAV